MILIIIIFFRSKNNDYIIINFVFLSTYFIFSFKSCVGFMVITKVYLFIVINYNKGNFFLKKYIINSTGIIKVITK